MSARSWDGVAIGIALPAPLDASAWSGSPLGLADGLRSYGVEVVPLSAALPRFAERAGERIGRRLPAWRAELLARRAALSRAVRRRSVDGIVMIGTFSELRSEVPFVTFEDMTVRQALAVGDPWVTERSPAELRAWDRRQRAVYDAAHAMCTLAPWAAESIVRDYGVARERVHVVGGGVNRVLEPTPRDWSVPRFLFVGRDFARKNGPAVLRAFAALHAERPDATLDVVGGHPPIDQPGVTGHGPLALGDPVQRERLDALYGRATCLVVPTTVSEAFGIVYAEAATAGVPSIATSSGGAFVDDRCGRRVDPGDERALLQAMRELCDGELARSLGERARERATQFRWPLVAGRVLRCFAGPLGQPVEGLPEFL